MIDLNLCCTQTGTEAWSNPHKRHQLNGDADDGGGDEEVTLSSHSAPSMTEDYKAYRGDDCELDSQDRYMFNFIFEMEMSKHDLFH